MPCMVVFPLARLRLFLRRGFLEFAGRHVLSWDFGIALGAIAVQCRSREHHQGDRRGDREEDADKYLGEYRTPFEHREGDHRCYDDARRAPARAKRRRMDAVIKGPKPDEPDAACQREAGAQQQEGCYRDCRPEGEICGRGHSMTSPRMRNFASATVATKPRTPIISDASK